MRCKLRYLSLGLLISLFFVICQGCARSQPQTFFPPDEVIPGAWVTEEYIPLILNKKVGLVVNHTSLIRNTHLVDSLLGRGVKVVKIFAPEHGLRGEADAGQHVADDVDKKTGIPVISIYGAKKKPTTDDLAGIDILVFDIQDVGVRFYTYISTLHFVIEAAGENNIPLIILDRPNPNGHYIDGSVLDTVEYRSFVGMHPIPVVYGMTIGELAKMINGEKWTHAQCELSVINCKNYDHLTSYDLPIKPSPNLPNLRSILLYPGLCFFEGTPVSIGRGTAFPFQVAGHPDYPDTAFSFVPMPTPGAMHPPLQGQVCYGIDLRSVDTDSLFNSREMNISVLLHFYDQLPEADFFNVSWFDKLSGGPAFRISIQNEFTEGQIRETWKESIEIFKKKRSLYLLYPDAPNCTPSQ